MRKGKENLRPVHFALIGITAFMAGYLYRSWQEAAATPSARQPALERCGRTYLESDLDQERLDARPLYTLPAATAGKSGEYL